MSKNKSIWNRGDALLLSDTLQERNFGRIFYEFTNLALNRFKWENLPQGLESRHIEKALFEYGQCAFVDDPELGILCLGCSNTNAYNPYGDPTHVVLHGVGYSKNFALSEVERILNNDTLLPTKFHVEYYTNKIYEIDKAIHKNLKQQKRPYVVATTKDNQLTMKNIMKQIKEDEEEIYVDDRLANGGKVSVEVLNTNAPYLIDKYQQHKNDLMCEFLTLMGLNNSNANNNKKERLLVDEVNVNNGEILMNLDVDFKNRLEACERINKRFGLNILVKKNIFDISNEFLSEEGEEGEQIHNRGIFPFKR